MTEARTPPSSIAPAGRDAVLPPIESPVRARKPRRSAKRSTRSRGGAAQAKARTRWQDLNEFVDESLRLLKSQSEVSVYITLFREARDGLAEVGGNDLAKRTGLHRNTVRIALRKLTELGLIRRIRVGRPGRGASVYEVYSRPRCDPTTAGDEADATARSGNSAGSGEQIGECPGAATPAPRVAKPASKGQPAPAFAAAADPPPGAVDWAGGEAVGR